MKGLFGCRTNRKSINNIDNNQHALTLMHASRQIHGCCIEQSEVKNRVSDHPQGCDITARSCQKLVHPCSV